MNIQIGFDLTDYGFRDAVFGLFLYKDLFLRVGLFFITFEIGYSLKEKYFLSTLRAGLPSKKVFTIQIEWNNTL